jgi:hypothetical protein
MPDRPCSPLQSHQPDRRPRRTGRRARGAREPPNARLGDTSEDNDRTLTATTPTAATGAAGDRRTSTNTVTATTAMSPTLSTGRSRSVTGATVARSERCSKAPTTRAVTSAAAGRSDGLPELQCEPLRASMPRAAASGIQGGFWLNIPYREWVPPFGCVRVGHLALVPGIHRFGGSPS